MAMGIVNIVQRRRSLSSMSLTPARIINLHQPIIRVTKNISETGSVPLVVCSYQAGAVHSQDAVSDPQSAVRGSRPFRDQGPDVNAWSIEGSVLQGGQVLVYRHWYWNVLHSIFISSNLPMTKTHCLDPKSVFEMLSGVYSPGRLWVPCPVRMVLCPVPLQTPHTSHQEGEGRQGRIQGKETHTH